LPEVPDDVVERLGRATEDWSFAYLSELRSTAAVLALSQQREMLNAQSVESAFQLLAAQFNAGRHNHTDVETDASGSRS
jgi:DNA helicase TIP49 (TBP-interacting protein)